VKVRFRQVPTPSGQAAIGQPMPYRKRRGPVVRGPYCHDLSALLIEHISLVRRQLMLL